MKNENNENQLTQLYLEAFDGPVAAPDHHKVIFENDRVRVMEFRVKPGDIVPVHTHRWSSINYVLRLSDFLSYDSGGNLKLDSRTGQFESKEGDVFCLPPFPPLHSVENIGESEMHGISIELKD
jgi:quercetin dioxygenase-like cupin family protein